MKTLAKILGILLIVCVSVSIFGQPTGRQFSSIQVLSDRIEIQVSDGTYYIEVLNDFIVHTSFFPYNKELSDFSFAAVMQAEKIDFTLTEEGNNISVRSKGICLKITKSPFRIQYFNQDEFLIAENRGFTMRDSLMTLNFGIDKSEVLYGGGARVLGMNRRGNRLQLYNRAHYGYETRSELMNYTLPLFLSSKKYAVLFDNASAGFLDLDSQKNNEVSYETETGIPNYYVVAGNSWLHLTEQYTRLTGTQPLPPRWAFGNFSSRFGYHSQAETEATVKKFQKENIPLDAVIIDIYWFGKDIKGTMGNLQWYADSFPNPEKMIRRFSKKGVKTILVTEPFILTTSKRWQEAVDEKILATDTHGKPYTYDFYFGNTGLIDIFDTTAQNWFWNIYKGLTLQGIGGWWGDLGEPEVHPSPLQHVNGSADEVHNAYGHEWARLIYEGYKKDFPETRPFILMRAGYAGSQRYGMIPWSGDVSRSWGGLVPQPEISLQMGMQGLAYMHSDLGGFAGGDTINNELYRRWLQYGIFQPVYRPHAQEHIPAEPVFQSEPTRNNARQSIEMRYRLIPYIYNMAFENSRTGKPLMMPLFFTGDPNPELAVYDQAYLWGDALLVSPVKQPGLTHQDIYLPRGTNWTDFYSGEIAEGGQTITATLHKDHIPVYVRGGSFIPMSSTISNTQTYSLEEFELHYYADSTVKHSTYQLYNDDGETPDTFSKGLFERMEFTAADQGNNLKINLVKSKASGYYKELKYDVDLKIHNLGVRPAGVRINGSYLSQDEIRWDDERKILSLSAGCSMVPQTVEVVKHLY
jgi:alpha-glucosidase (family GH31 glycosyl hydrolase)